MSAPRILFITPAASRSGAPMLMLHLIRWFKAHSAYRPFAILVSGGEMNAEFEAEVPVELFETPEPPASRALRWYRRRPAVIRKLHARKVKRCQSVVGHWPPDIVFCNSAAAVGVLDALGPYTCPVVVNLHELPYVLRAINWIAGGVLPLMKRHASRYIAGSIIVSTKLSNEFDIPSDRISVVHDFISVAEFDFVDRTQGTRSRAGWLNQHQIPSDAIIVGFIATVEWRKGADLLVALARALLAKQLDPRLHLVWVGGGPLADVAQLAFDIATAGMASRVHLPGPTRRTADWYPSFDLFVLPSREDPFPLVCLEAAATGLPIVCFEGGGGMPEFVEDDCGITVPYLDLQAMADAIARLVDNQSLRLQMGTNAASKVRARHDAAIAGPEVLKVLQRLTSSASA